jgi:hypothetical protein
MNQFQQLPSNNGLGITSNLLQQQRGPTTYHQNIQGRPNIINY